MLHVIFARGLGERIRLDVLCGLSSCSQQDECFGQYSLLLHPGQCQCLQCRWYGILTDSIPDLRTGLVVFDAVMAAINGGKARGSDGLSFF